MVFYILLSLFLFFEDSWFILKTNEISQNNKDVILEKYTTTASVTVHFSYEIKYEITILVIVLYFTKYNNNNNNK